MTQFVVKRSSLTGHLKIPPSKSHTLRAIVFGMMGKGKSIIRNYLHSPDTDAMVQAARCFGAKVDIHSDRLEIEGLNGQLQAAEDVIDAGNSGQVLRFIGALAALVPSYTVITGDHSIRHRRPVTPLLSALQQLGAFAESAKLNGYAPILIKGPVRPGKTRLSGEDSQPVSALLIAASFLDGESEIEVANPGEKPWIDLTLNWLDRLGIRYENDNYTRYKVFGKASIAGFEIDIPADFSSAAFPLAAALITDSEVTLHQVDMEDVQGDKKIIDALIAMGAKIAIDRTKRTLTVKKGSQLRGMRLDINDYVDALPILAVIGCFAEGTTEIVNAAIARHKESDRIHCIVSELKKMGASIEETDDGLIVHRSSLHGAYVNSAQDHRIAMALAVAALNTEGTTTIDGIACVAKTYPTFAKDFRILGAAITVV